MIPVRQSTAFECSIGPVLDADGVAVTGGVVGDLKIKKTTGNFAALNASATLTHVSAGVYDLVLTTSDTDTVGLATIAMDDTVNACAPLHLQVMEEAIYDALYAASANAWSGAAGSSIGVANATQFAGQTITAAAGVTLPSSVASPTNITAGTITTVTTLTNLPAITANWLTAAGTAADFSTEVNAGVLAVLGALNDAAADGAVTTTDTMVAYLKQIINTLEGAPGIPTWPAAAAPGNAVSIAEAVRHIYDQIGAAGVALTEAGGDGDHFTAINLPNQTMDIVGNITGNLSGSVGSVTGAVGSVTGNVGGNVTGSVGSVAAGGITAASIADAAIDRATFTADTGLQTIRSNTAQAGGNTTITLDASASAVDDFYNNCIVFLTGGTGVGQSRFISDYVGATKVATVPTWATNPDNTSTFAVLPFGSIPGATAPTASEIADEVQTRTIAAVTLVNGLAANVITAAATAADFGTEVGTAVWASGTRTVTSLAGLTVDTVTTLTNLPAITANWLTAAGTAADFGTEVGTAVWATTTRVLTAGTNIQLPSNGLANVTAWTVDVTGSLSGSVGSVTGAVGSVTAAITLPTIPNNWIAATGIATDAFTAAKFHADVTTELQSGLATAASIAALNNITAASVWSVGTRTLTAGTNIDGSTFTAIPWNATWDAEVQSECADALVAYDGLVPADLPSNFAALGINVSGHISRVVLVDTLTTYTGNTLQTGDAFARLGAPTGASVSADIAALQADHPGRPTRAVQFDNLEFMMVDATDLNTPETGITVTATISKDGAAFAACTNAVSEISGGWYKITLTATEMTADRIALKMTCSGCAQRNLFIVTQPT